MISVSHKNYADAWQTKVNDKLFVNFPLPWLLLAGILFVPVYFVLTRFETDNSLVLYFGIESILIASIANAVIFYERLMDEVAEVLPLLMDSSKDEATRFVDRFYEYTFWSSRNIWVGAVLALVLAVTGLHSSLDRFQSVQGIVCAVVYNVLVGFFGGSMFWAMLGIAKLMTSLGREVKLKISIFDSSTSPLRTASSVMLKVSLTAVLVYLLGASMHLSLTNNFHIYNLSIIAAFGLFVILYFIIPQVNIHKTLVRIKGDRLGKLVNQIDHAFDEVTGNPTSENIGNLKELFNLQRVVIGKKEWSFGTKELLTLISSIIVPLLLFVLSYYLKK